MIEGRSGERPLAGHRNAEDGIGKPDRPIGRHSHIIGRIEALALEMGDDGYGYAGYVGI